VDPQQQVIDYHHRLESRLGYTPLLGGTKHFGWYRPGPGACRCGWRSP
jgi:hypothetical protein